MMERATRAEVSFARPLIVAQLGRQLQAFEQSTSLRKKLT
jgi:hypothetical protein